MAKNFGVAAKWKTAPELQQNETKKNRRKKVNVPHFLLVEKRKNIHNFFPPIVFLSDIFYSFIFQSAFYY
jgi:hypothetical protein